MTSTRSLRATAKSARSRRDGLKLSPGRSGHVKPGGVARARQPVRDRESRLWRARYVDLDGVVRQSGRFERKGDAVAHTTELVSELNRTGRRKSQVPTLAAFLDEWAHRFPRHPRTQATNLERIRLYVLPNLAIAGEVPLDELRRADLRDVQDALLRQRLAKTTIDGVFSALSAVLGDAVDIELIDALTLPHACEYDLGTRAWLRCVAKSVGERSRLRKSARSSPRSLPRTARSAGRQS